MIANKCIQKPSILMRDHTNEHEGRGMGGGSRYQFLNAANSVTETQLTPYTEIYTIFKMRACVMKNLCCRLLQKVQSPIGQEAFVMVMARAYLRGR